MTRNMRFSEAINEAIAEEMERDPTVVCLGEDISFGGPFTVTRGLKDRFGESRVLDTPIAEETIAGAALGAAITGLRPIAEIGFGDFLMVCMDQVANQIAKWRYVSGGQIKVPLVIRSATGGGAGLGCQHSQSLEALFVHLPGLKVVAPSTPRDAKGLMKASVRDDSPVVFMEHKLLYGLRGDVPEQCVIPLGTADIKREGQDVTVVATMEMVHKALRAAEKLEEDRISVAIIDPRTLVPLDKRTILDSVKKTGRLVIASEECKTGSVASEIAATVGEEAFDYLDAPILRVASLDTPIPFSVTLEEKVIPQVHDIVRAVKETMA
jgi:pyruvate/2-oxoglutarate/acetoin dehydrogenase E1 component